MGIKRAGGHVLTENGWQLVQDVDDEPDQVEVSDTPPAFVCDECAREFKTAGGLSSHQRAKHPEDDDASEEE